MSLTIPISTEPFGHLPDGLARHALHSRKRNGLRVSITNYGGAITSLWAPDRHGVLDDVALGYDSVAGYLAGKCFFGGIIGRFGNRIAQGRFTLDGVEFQLPANNDQNHLHGGPNGFHTVPWQAELVGDGVRFSRLSPHGEEGYPGNLRLAVTYTLTGSSSASITPPRPTAPRR